MKKIFLCNFLHTFKKFTKYLVFWVANAFLLCYNAFQAVAVMPPQPKEFYTMSRKKRRYRKQQNGASSISAAGKISSSARTESRSSAVVRADKPMRVEAAASSTPRSGGNRKSDHRQDKISGSEEVSSSARTESRKTGRVGINRKKRKAEILGRKKEAAKVPVRSRNMAVHLLFSRKEKQAFYGYGCVFF